MREFWRRHDHELVLTGCLILQLSVLLVAYLAGDALTCSS